MNYTECFERNYYLLGPKLAFSFLSCLFIIGMIVILILLQRYKFFTQRLSLYLAITAFGYSASNSVDFTSYYAPTNTIALYYCRIIGYVQTNAIMFFYMATAVIMIVVFIEVTCKRATDQMEVLFVFLIFGLPLLITWIPFVTDDYGPLGSACWFTLVDMETCEISTTGVILIIAIYFVPTKLIMIIVSLLLLVTLIFVKRQRKVAKMQREQENRHQMRKQLETELRPLMTYPVIVLVANLLAFAAFLAMSFDGENFYVRVMSIIIFALFPLQGAFITIAYAMKSDTRRKLKPRELKFYCRRCCACCKMNRKKSVREYETGIPKSDSWQDYLSPYRDIEEV
uniref:G-protein coupled receptors family 2 profile 2 domain-containing protein n=1 Tax=Amphimedon queenslandica TaxID=400682 RepID=A0A1X7UQJ8_AMPQE